MLQSLNGFTHGEMLISKVKSFKQTFSEIVIVKFYARKTKQIWNVRQALMPSQHTFGQHKSHISAKTDLNYHLHIKATQLFKFEVIFIAVK